MDGQGTKRRRNIAENFNPLSRAHERFRRQTTDGRAIAYSKRECEREFTFAKNHYIWLLLLRLNLSTEGFPWDDFRKLFSECQRMADVPNGVKTLPKISTA